MPELLPKARNFENLGESKNDLKKRKLPSNKESISDYCYG
jgi:hypothetical protein